MSSRALLVAIRSAGLASLLVLIMFVNIEDLSRTTATSPVTASTTTRYELIVSSGLVDRPQVNWYHERNDTGENHTGGKYAIDIFEPWDTNADASMARVYFVGETIASKERLVTRALRSGGPCTGITIETRYLTAAPSPEPPFAPGGVWTPVARINYVHIESDGDLVLDRSWLLPDAKSDDRSFKTLLGTILTSEAYHCSRPYLIGTDRASGRLWTGNHLHQELKLVLGDSLSDMDAAPKQMNRAIPTVTKPGKSQTLDASMWLMNPRVCTVTMVPTASDVAVACPKYGLTVATNPLEVGASAVSVAPDEDVRGEVPASGPYLLDTNVELSAVNPNGFVFAHWAITGSTGPQSTVLENPATVTMDRDKTVTAVFREAACAPEPGPGPSPPYSVTLCFTQTVLADLAVNAAERRSDWTFNVHLSESATGSAGARTEAALTPKVTIGNSSPLDVTAVSGEPGTWSVAVPAAAAYLTDGKHTLRVQALRGEEVVKSESTTITVDLTAPTVSYAPPTSLTVNTAITDIVPTTSDEDIASYALKADSTLPLGLGLNTISTSPDHGVISGTPSATALARIVRIVVTDRAGNTSEVRLDLPAVTGAPDPYAPPTNLALARHATDGDRLEISFTRPSGPDTLEFELYRSDSSGSFCEPGAAGCAGAVATTASGLSPVAFDGLTRASGYTYRARGRGCERDDGSGTSRQSGNPLLTCGEWSGWSGAVELPPGPAPTPPPDPDPEPIVTIALQSPSSGTMEEGGTATFVLTRTRDTLASALLVLVDVGETRSMIAEAPSEVLMPASLRTHAFEVRTDDDATDELASMITATVLDRGAAYDPGSPDSATVAVTDNDPATLSVRIAARVVASGRVEVALQQRGADGQWGSRRLPAVRFLEVVADIGVWVWSRPALTVSAPLTGHSADLRITARRLADSRAEFGLQQLGADGQWGSRILPRVRILNTDLAIVDTWYPTGEMTVVTASVGAVRGQAQAEDPSDDQSMESDPGETFDDPPPSDLADDQFMQPGN